MYYGTEGNRIEQTAGVSETGAGGGPALQLCTRGALAPEMTREDLRQEVEKELTGREEEPQPIYLKLYKSQIPVIEHAIERAAQMPGSDNSRGLCLKVI